MKKPYIPELIPPFKEIPIDQIPEVIKALNEQALKMNKVLDRYPHLTATYTHDAFTVTNEIRTLLTNYRHLSTEVFEALAKDETGIKELRVNDLKKVNKDFNDILFAVIQYEFKLKGDPVYDDKWWTVNGELIQWKKNIDIIEIKKKLKLPLDKVAQWDDVIEEFNITRRRPELKSDLELTIPETPLSAALSCSCSNGSFIPNYKPNDHIPVIILIISVVTGFVIFQYLIDWRFPTLETIPKENISIPETEVTAGKIVDNDKPVFCSVCGSIIEYAK